jgi:hypothetical protein
MKGRLAKVAARQRENRPLTFGSWSSMDGFRSFPNGLQKGSLRRTMIASQSRLKNEQTRFQCIISVCACSKQLCMSMSSRTFLQLPAMI